MQKTGKLLEDNSLDALIITNSYNILYLTGFKGISDTEREAILIVTRSVIMTLITAKLYQTEAKKLKNKDLNIKIARERSEMRRMIFTVLKGKQSASRRIGFEETNLTVAELNNYKIQLPGKVLIGTKDLIENLRMIKTADEIKKIEKAQIISQKAFDLLLPTIKPGQTELEVKYRLESIMRELGSEGTAFETIIASGPNSGIPHHKTGKRKLQPNDTLLFDFGAKYKNYCADLSRTIFIGKPSDRQVNIYLHVATAQKTAIAGIRHGLKTHHAFNLANEYFKKHRLEKYFTHGLGHGIGLEVHEAPHLRNQPPETNDQLLENMVFSVEPGLYFPWGGVRIEDLVAIKNGKPKILGKMQKRPVVIRLRYDEG